MSATGLKGVSPLIDALGARGNEAAGNQAQVGQHLILMQRLVAAVEGGSGSFSGLYTTYIFGGGSLDIAVTYPGITTGTFILTAASTVTLPATGGPWIIADGSGFCSPSAQITVNSSGVTVQQAPDYYMVQAFQAQTFIKDGGSANYIVL